MENNYYKGKSPLLDRFFHAARGIRYAWEREPNFKIELVIGILVLVGMMILPLSGLERAVLVIMVAFVLGLEIINSAIERTLDILHPSLSPAVKYIKDTLAGAVLLGSLASVLVGGFILIPALLAFDITVSQWISAVDFGFLSNLANLVTYLGNWQVILALVLIFIPWLVYKKHYELISLLLGSAVGSPIIAFLLKNIFSRPRPLLLEAVDEPSFPSGHALVGTAFWLTVGYLITEKSTKRRYLWLVIGVIILLVALTRVILSVHWFSDVLGGVLIGAFWFFLWFGINKKLFSET